MAYTVLAGPRGGLPTSGKVANYTARAREGGLPSSTRGRRGRAATPKWLTPFLLRLPLPSLSMKFSSSSSSSSLPLSGTKFKADGSRKKFCLGESLLSPAGGRPALRFRNVIEQKSSSKRRQPRMEGEERRRSHPSCWNNKEALGLGLRLLGIMARNNRVKTKLEAPLGFGVLTFFD